MPIELAAVAMNAAAQAPRRARRTGDRFVLPDDDDAAAAPQEVLASGPAAQAAAVQAASLAQAPLRQAAADEVAAGQGRALLGALAGLQLASLGGGGGVQARATLADLARALPASADPGLDAVLRAIAQRAAIELARAG